jgi:Clp amino terminal domain, pathogenicity island component
MRKGEGPVELKDLIRAVQDVTMSCSELERLDVAVKYGELLKEIGDDLVGHFVEEARKDGASWSQIGQRLGVSKQAAHQRHVQRAPRLFGRRRRSSGEPFFVRFSQEARDVVVRAQEEARSFKHNYLGVEHLLIALSTEAGGSAGGVLREAGVTPERLRAQVELKVGEGRETPSGRISFTPRSKQALQLARRVAGSGLIETRHVLLGILELPDGMGVEILDSFGVSRDELRRRTEASFGG